MKSVLMVWGGWEGHEPKQCVEIVAPVFESEGFEVEIKNTTEPFADAEKTNSYNLVVPCWTIGNTC